MLQTVIVAHTDHKSRRRPEVAAGMQLSSKNVTRETAGNESEDQLIGDDSK
jgi:hypothetical protein